MGRYVASRIAAILGTLLIISLFVFVLMHAIPGGPFDEDKMPLSPGRHGAVHLYQQGQEIAGTPQVLRTAHRL